MKKIKIFLQISLLLAIAAIVCSFTFNKPQKVQRRKGILSTDIKGKVIFTPLEDWKDCTPKNDTVYEFKVK